LPQVAKSVNGDLLKGFAVPQMAQKHGWKESLVWSQALVNTNDFDRFKALQWGIRTWDIWNFTDCDFRFGDEWPGKKRGVIQADREDAAPGGGVLWVESHSDVFATWSWAWKDPKPCLKK
jgi:hypothetical protein